MRDNLGAPLPYQEEKFSSAYKASRAHYPAAWLNTILNFVKDDEQNLALDVACGNGQASLTLAAAYKKVIALDKAQTQVDNPLLTANEKISYLQGSAESLPQELSAQVDLIVVAQAMHWFDIPRFLSEARRILKPHGVLAVSVYGPELVIPEFQAAEAILDDFRARIAGRIEEKDPNLLYWYEPFRTSYATVDFPFAHIQKEQFHMSQAMNLTGLVRYASSWALMGSYANLFSDTQECLAELRTNLSKVMHSDSHEFEVQHKGTIILCRSGIKHQD